MKNKTTEVRDVYPFTTYTMTRGELKATLLRYGGWFFYNGEAWAIKSKHLGAGVYKVWTERKTD